MYIGFTYNQKNPISKLIAWITKSKWSHCFVVVGPIGNTDYLIAESSMTGGIKFNLLSKYDKLKYNLELIDLGDKCHQSDLEAILPLIGHMYGYIQAIGYLVAKILNLKTNPFHDDVVCSELVYQFLLHTSLKPLIENLDPNSVTPEQLYERLKKWQNSIL